MKITNDGQFSNIYKNQIPFPYQRIENSKPDYRVDTKRLTSNSWVTVKNRTKNSIIKDSPHADYRVKRVGNFWIDIDKPHKPKMSETELAQWELYRKLKKEYDLKQKIRSRNTNELRTTTIQNTHQIVDGVMVNMKRIVNFDGSKYRKGVVAS